MSSELKYTVQPLHAIMEQLELKNHDLVVQFPGELTHKAVQKARLGRRTTTRMQVKITEALNRAVRESEEFITPYKRGDLFLNEKNSEEE
jgi:hypothetical protein